VLGSRKSHSIEGIGKKKELSLTALAGGGWGPCGHVSLAEPGGRETRDPRGIDSFFLLKMFQSIKF
jgi:hypothetical protein